MAAVSGNHSTIGFNGAVVLSVEKLDEEVNVIQSRLEKLHVTWPRQNDLKVQYFDFPFEYSMVLIEPVWVVYKDRVGRYVSKQGGSSQIEIRYFDDTHVLRTKRPQITSVSAFYFDKQVQAIQETKKMIEEAKLDCPYAREILLLLVEKGFRPKIERHESRNDFIFSSPQKLLILSVYLQPAEREKSLEIPAEQIETVDFSDDESDQDEASSSERPLVNLCEENALALFVRGEKITSQIYSRKESSKAVEDLLHHLNSSEDACKK